MTKQELTLEQAIDLETIVSWCSGNVKISLCKQGSAAYYAAIGAFGHKVTTTSIVSFNAAHQAYILGCLGISPNLRAAAIDSSRWRASKESTS